MAARLPYLERDQVPAEIQTLYDTFQKATGRVLNIFKLMAHHAKSLPPFLQWYPALRDGPHHLSPEALTQLTLTIAVANFTNRFNDALGTELES